ncbi:vitamin D-binding protein [Microcaecilia unicolor]|uniref:Vitamin D-binding protein-like n=1 Tax=Microcaecilia unicolor TaxID=1415580 RepID=A0A6P7XDV3_9AMPH|nr:vitamin D-binding protein-like [Microcaecilia unicolor]
MKSCIRVVWAILLLSIIDPMRCTQRQRYPRHSSGENRGNTGCELSQKTDVAFRLHTLVYYSQRLVFNTLKDMNRLLDQLKSFVSSCCSENAEPECFLSEKYIFQARICGDSISQSKNRAAALCCGKISLEREMCFRDLQNKPPIKLPPLADHFSHAEECLAFTADSQLFVESYLHGLARRLSIFSWEMISRISHAYLLMYVTCCSKSEQLKQCFSSKKEEFVDEMKEVIENGNKICEKSKNGVAMNSLWAIIFYAKKKPRGSWEDAKGFGELYADFVSRCCLPEFTTSECFQTQSDILSDYFCTLPTIRSHEECCLKRDLEMTECFEKLAFQESQAISEISLEPNQLCELNSQSQEDVLLRCAYEYGRRHTDQNTHAILNSSIEARNTIRECCVTEDPNTCFSTHFPIIFQIN